MPYETTLAVPDGARARVFRALCDHLEADPVLKAVIDAENWFVLDDRQAHEEAFGAAELTQVRVTPRSEAASPLTTTGQMSPLGIQVEVCTPGPRGEDLLNLWEAVEAALFTGDGAAAALAALSTAVAGLPRQTQVISLRLSQPAIDPNPSAYANGLLYASGSLTIEMKVRK